ncbi:MAG: hypothetical protein RLZZ337_225 [Bacteroidota bacterium]|jgi:hypothetical protein
MKKLKTSIAVVLLFVAAISAMSFVTKSTPKQIAKKAISKVMPQEEVVETPVVREKSVFEVADSICQEAGVPFELVKEIGQNESGWRYISNANGGTDHGDLQVIDPTFWYWYKKLDLTGGKTRRNYLKVAIYYLRHCYDATGSWKKARFAYGRGKWRDESTWTPLEQKFMGKIDWSNYDH